MPDTKSLAAILPSWLEKQEENMFQEIKRLSAEAEREGRKLIKLSVGQPLGPALLSARWKAAECIMFDDDRWHEYQDNKFLPFGSWAEDFCQMHIEKNLSAFGEKAACMPIPGIKPMLGLIPLACGGRGKAKVQSMTDPGYPVPKTWCAYAKIAHTPFCTNSKNNFLPEMGKEALGISLGINLAMFNLPHNPSGQIATREYWCKVCAYCEENHIRIFNDAAYILLSHALDSCALADVATEFPNLSWMEAYSASKEIGNGTGWRVGAVIGSPGFVGDLGIIKGNTDSGFFAAAAAGALHALQNDRERIRAIREKYGRRLLKLSEALATSGMNISIQPRAGFFLLCQAPQVAFGRQMEDAKDFNQMMIRNTGIVGVPFHPYLRFAVVGPVEDWLDQIFEGFRKARPEYTN